MGHSQGQAVRWCSGEGLKKSELFLFMSFFYKAFETRHLWNVQFKGRKEQWFRVKEVKRKSLDKNNSKSKYNGNMKIIKKLCFVLFYSASSFCAFCRAHVVSPHSSSLYLRVQ